MRWFAKEKCFVRGHGVDHFALQGDIGKKSQFRAQIVQVLNPMVKSYGKQSGFYQIVFAVVKDNAGLAPNMFL